MDTNQYSIIYNTLKKENLILRIKARQFLSKMGKYSMTQSTWFFGCGASRVAGGRLQSKKRRVTMLPQHYLFGVLCCLSWEEVVADEQEEELEQVPVRAVHHCSLGLVDILLNRWMDRWSAAQFIAGGVVDFLVCSTESESSITYALAFMFLFHLMHHVPLSLPLSQALVGGYLLHD